MSAVIQRANYHMTSLTDNKIVILMLINLLLLVVGMIMDTTPAILILSPILYPVAQAYGIDIIHFGLIMVSTPPATMISASKALIS